MRIIVFFFAVFSLGQIHLLKAQTAVDDELAYTKIFDGKTLTGWAGETELWRVEDGTIVGEIPDNKILDHNTWLVWEDGRLDDFDLRLKFRIAGKPAANSGIQFRCQVENIKHVSGYHIHYRKLKAGEHRIKLNTPANTDK